MTSIDPDAMCRVAKSLADRAAARQPGFVVARVLAQHGVSQNYFDKLRRWHPGSNESFQLHKLAAAQAAAEELLRMPIGSSKKTGGRRPGYRAPRPARPDLPRRGGYGEILDPTELTLMVQTAVRDALSLASRLDLAEALSASPYDVSAASLYGISRWLPSSGRSFRYQLLHDAFYFSVQFIESKTKEVQ